MIKRNLLRFRCHVPLWLCLLFIGGCGTAAYDAKFNESLAALKLETPFRELFTAPTELPEHGLSVRLPRIFDSGSQESYAFDSQTPEPRDPQLPLIPIRVLPEFLDLEGHVRTYERTWEFIDSKRQLRRRPIYCYLAIVRKPGHSEAIKAAIESQVNAAFADQGEPTVGQKRSNPGVEFGVDGWQAASLPTPNGETISVHRIAATGQYLFPYYADAHKPTINTEIDIGSFVAYIYSSEPTPEFPSTADAVVAWFTPYWVAGEIDLDTLAAATMGTVVVGAPQPPAE